ncbi:hypothetical protein LV779_18190 [Streptomyces thinghirensis]|nr:hypothetical protein [Streptomyces thinghirensis]
MERVRQQPRVRRHGPATVSPGQRFTVKYARAPSPSTLVPEGGPGRSRQDQPAGRCAPCQPEADRWQQPRQLHPVRRLRQQPADARAGGLFYERHHLRAADRRGRLHRPRRRHHGHLGRRHSFDDTGLSMKRLDTTINDFTPVQCYPDPATPVTLSSTPCSDHGPVTAAPRDAGWRSLLSPPGVEPFSTVPRPAPGTVRNPRTT